MADFAPFGADGHTVSWATWDGNHREVTTVAWENEGWTVVGDVGRERVQYVVRLSALWHVRQFLLFRDLDEPDLWLGTDGAGRWGEINGAHRPDLDGCVDVHLRCTPFTTCLPIRRLPLEVGDSATLDVAVIDPDTLEVRRQRQQFTRTARRAWQRRAIDVALHGDADVDADDGQFEVDQFEVDEWGLVIDYPAGWRRVGSGS